MQISDSHIGFDKPANTDVTATLRAAIAKIKAAPRAAVVRAAHRRPDAPVEAGGVRHAAAGADRARRCRCSTCPASTTCSRTTARAICSDSARARKAPAGTASITSGVHFIGLVNVVNLKAGGLGTLGDEQLEWLEKDVKRLKSSTPIVVFAHIPLWSVYPEWGWGTDDSAQALSYLKRFGSVSVLNGHIHQVMQKVEGHVTFHTAMSTAFPQPAPGTAPSPGPMKVEADRLKKVLGSGADVVPRCQSSHRGHRRRSRRNRPRLGH